MMRFSSSTRYQQQQQQQHHFQMKSFAGLTLVLLTISSSLCAPPASAFPQPPYFPQPPEDFGGLFNPWASFFNFSGCHSGESRQGLAQIKQYLQQFGYLPSSDTYTDDFDDSLESAILSYQRNLGLNATGYLDPSTLQVMVQPRCGVADVADNGTGTRGRGLYAFFPGTPTWPRTKSVLTYALASTSAVSIDQAVLRAVFARAFARWAEVTTLSFTEVDPSASPDISIGFFSGNHGDGEPFDGVLGTLAHAFSPTDGRFHLDASETWVASLDGGAASPDLLRSTVAIDLESVAVHEIGHLLGLGHSSVEGAIMYPTIRSRTRRVELARDDVDGIQSLYGNNPNFNGTSALPGSTGTATTTTTGTMRERYNGAAADGRPAVGWGALTLSAAALVAFWWGRL